MGQHKLPKPKTKPNGGQLVSFPDSVFKDPKPRTWRAVQFGTWYPSVDTSVPPAYLLVCEGQRSDDVVFKVTVALSKSKVDMIPSAKIALQVCRDAMQNALNDLQTFRDCRCTLEVCCEVHQ